MLKAIKISCESILEKIPFTTENVPIKFLTEEEQVNKAEIHDNVADLFFILSGEMVFTCNGKLINPEKSLNDQNTLIADKIENGTEYYLKTGDWLFVPENCPHQRTILKKSNFVVIKIPKK